jgi:hypothetical protein
VHARSLGVAADTRTGSRQCNAPKRVCLMDDLGGTEAHPCTDATPPAMCRQIPLKGAPSSDKVFYQEYAQTAACGCMGCNTKTPDGKTLTPSSDNRCKSVGRVSPKQLRVALVCI